MVATEVSSLFFMFPIIFADGKFMVLFRPGHQPWLRLLLDAGSPARQESAY